MRPGFCSGGGESGWCGQRKGGRCCEAGVGGTGDAVAGRAGVVAADHGGERCAGSDVDADGDGHCDRYCDGDCNPFAHSDGDGDADRNGNANGNEDLDTDGDGHQDAHSDQDADSDGNADDNTHGDARAGQAGDLVSTLRYGSRVRADRELGRAGDELARLAVGVSGRAADVLLPVVHVGRRAECDGQLGAFGAADWRQQHPLDDEQHLE